MRESVRSEERIVGGEKRGRRESWEERNVGGENRGRRESWEERNVGGEKCFSPPGMHMVH